MTEFVIDTDVEAPSQRAARKGAYPWDALKKGNSFFVPGVKGLSAPSRLREKGWEFTTQRREEGGEKGVRAWRTK